MSYDGLKNVFSDFKERGIENIKASLLERSVGGLVQVNTHIESEAVNYSIIGAKLKLSNITTEKHFLIT